MIKFKQYITEVEIRDTIKKEGGVAPTGIKNDVIASDHTPVSSSKFTGKNGKDYHVTMALNNGVKHAHTVFVHHENDKGDYEHVGTIEGRMTGHKTLTPDYVQLAPHHQGGEVMLDAHKELIKKHGLELHSSKTQSEGGIKVWNKLHSDPELNVEGHYLGKRFKLEHPPGHESNSTRERPSDYGRSSKESRITYIASKK